MKKLLLVLSLFLFSTVTSFACRCAEPRGSLSEQVTAANKNTDVIFTGKVVGKKEVNIESVDSFNYVFEISEEIKGNLVKKTVEIGSEFYGGSCDYYFEVGKTYLVYARKSTAPSNDLAENSTYVTTLCDRNQEARYVEAEELEVLRKMVKKG